jgi:hypothetical protein
VTILDPSYWLCWEEVGYQCSQFTPVLCLAALKLGIAVGLFSSDEDSLVDNHPGHCFADNIHLAFGCICLLLLLTNMHPYPSNCSGSFKGGCFSLF